MRNAIFSFTKPTPNSTVASNRIATFLSDTLDLPLLTDNAVDAKWDVLIIVNGGFAFCPVRDELGRAVRRAKRVIWVQNDYTIYCPTDVGTAQTPFRRAFTRRRELGLPAVDQWTTVMRLASKTPHSTYINWNSLTALPKALPPTATHTDTLFYYGAYRVGREAAFQEYFKRPWIDTVVSSTSKKFSANFPDIQVDPAMTPENFYGTLNHHGLGLYIEDARSHRDFHSPANRFYEMLSAGLPMVFEPAALPMLKVHAGIDADRFCIRRPRKDFPHLLNFRQNVAEEQHDMWWQPYRKQLVQRVKAVYREYLQLV